MLALGVPTSTNLRIDAEINRNINEIGQFRPCCIDAFEDDHIGGWNCLRRGQPAVVGIPVVRLERG